LERFPKVLRPVTQSSGWSSLVSHWMSCD